MDFDDWMEHVVQGFEVVGVALLSEPTTESALVLATIVLVRTFLSFSLEIELEGVVPWRRAATTGPRSDNKRAESIAG